MPDRESAVARPQVPPLHRTTPRGWARSDTFVEKRSSRRLLVGVAAATALSLLLFDVRVEVGEHRAAATSERSTALADPEGAATGRSTDSDAHRASVTGPAQRSPIERRFAWAPSPGATGYHVEFFRGTERVFVQRTARPEVIVPGRWTFGGSRQSLRPGEYRWYVWPESGGERRLGAIVQTSVVIPAD
jgi:hypothetical protein